MNDVTIFTAITATQSPKWRFQTMFSAAKFVVAGAIVALFGGFLLIAQPSDHGAVIAPGAESSATGVENSPSNHESIPWGSGRVYYV